jgi:hypothetical protein
MADADLIVTIEHMKQAKLCARGGRTWCKRYGIDWLHFVNNGIPASTLAATGDAFALRLIEVAKEEQEGRP